MDGQTPADPGPQPRRVRRAATVAAVALSIVGSVLTLTGARVSADARPTAAPASVVSPAAARPDDSDPRVLTLPLVAPGIVVLSHHDVGDPSILTVPSGAAGNALPLYVATWTTDGRRNVPMATSVDLVHWQQLPDALPRLPVWAAQTTGSTWGPDEVRIGRFYVLYYSTVDAASHHQCIGRAVATDPTGPFVDRSRRPLVCQTGLGGDIDPTMVVSGRSHTLLWKNDGNSAGKSVALWSAPLNADGRALVGRPHRILRPHFHWEHHIIEGPAMMPDTRGGWWLFYSGGYWQSPNYDTGVAWCPTPAGPCRSASRPLITSRPTAVSPGGFSPFVGPGGLLWASWSVFPARPANPRAALSSDRVLEVAPILTH